jgi:hypothetical protein
VSTYANTWTDGHGTIGYFTRSNGSRLGLQNLTLPGAGNFSALERPSEFARMVSARS